MAWVGWPDAQQIGAWRFGADQPTYAIAGALDGLGVLPGFSYALARVVRVTPVRRGHQVADGVLFLRPGQRKITTSSRNCPLVAVARRVRNKSIRTSS
jgi:hypothetical protein